MIQKMRKVQIIGPRGCLDDCIKALHDAAVVHIESVEAGSREPFLSRLPMEREKLSEKSWLDKAAERLRNLLALLEPPPSYRTLRVGSDEIRKILEEITPVEERIKLLHSRKDELTEELNTVSRYERLLTGFAPIVSRLGGLKNFDIIGLTIEKTREDISRMIDSEINKITGGSYQLYSKDLDESSIGIVLTYPRQYEPEVRYLLSGKAINEVRLPDEYADMTLMNALKQMGRRGGELPRLMEGVEGELKRIASDWYGVMAGLLRAVEDSVDEIGVLTYAAQTRFAFVIEGWVPVDMFEPLKERFSTLFGDRVLVRELEVQEREAQNIPVSIKNPWFLRPFEVFLGALPPPKYGSVDPTLYVALFFPAFWGLIVGDIGYGAVIFGLSLYLRKRFRANNTFRDIFTVLAVSSAAAVFFGFLFGEFFGDLGERLGILHPLLINRVEALRTLIALTMGIGIGHVLLGIIIGAVNHLLKGRAKEAAAKTAYLALVVSFLVILGIMFEYLPKELLTPGAIVLVISFILLTVLEGVLGPLEFVKAIGNIVSYVRLMAVGTASVVMALVANQIGGLSENLVVGIIVAGLIHSLNLILSVLSPSIQSMRLHYVEFFSKFYEAGGRRYTPFKKR